MLNIRVRDALGLYPGQREEVLAMDQNVEHSTISDETMLRHIAYCGVLVAAVACAFAWIANTVG